MNARANRGVGKSDPLDARRIAQAALPLDHTQLRLPRTDEGARAALRILIASRDHITNERTAAINALIALLRVVDLGIGAPAPRSSPSVSPAPRPSASPSVSAQPTGSWATSPAR